MSDNEPDPTLPRMCGQTAESILFCCRDRGHSGPHACAPDPIPPADTWPCEHCGALWTYPPGGGKPVAATTEPGEGAVEAAKEISHRRDYDKRDDDDDVVADLIQRLAVAPAVLNTTIAREEVALSRRRLAAAAVENERLGRYIDDLRTSLAAAEASRERVIEANNKVAIRLADAVDKLEWCSTRRTEEGARHAADLILLAAAEARERGLVSELDTFREFVAETRERFAAWRAWQESAALADEPKDTEESDDDEG